MYWNVILTGISTVSIFEFVFLNLDLLLTGQILTVFFAR